MRCTHRLRTPTQPYDSNGTVCMGVSVCAYVLELSLARRVLSQ